MAKRTQKQIELDCKRIQEASKTATSFKQIGEITGLTQSEIRTSLSKHPRISKKVQSKVEENKATTEFENSKKENAQSEVKKTKTKKQESAKVNNEFDYEMGFVIDTSMVEVDAIIHMLCNICETDAKVILTSIVRQELNVMQFVKRDYKAKRARNIMAMAAQNPSKFCNVLIDETLPTHDDCIVKYCVENKERVILLTADKNMALDAREKAVKVEFFKKAFKTIKTLKKSTISKKGKVDVRTLYPARSVNNKLIIMEMQGEKRDIRVWSNGQEFSEGIVELKVGDDVFVAAVKKNFITFAHYQMITVYEEDNCKLMYCGKIFNCNEIDALPKEEYKSFARDFWNKHHLKE